MEKIMALVLQFLIAVIFLLSLGFAINLAIAYYSNNSNDNSTNTNTTNSTIMENITGGTEDTITIPMKPSDKDATLF